MLDQRTKKQMKQVEPGDSSVAVTPNIGNSTDGLNQCIPEFSIMNELGEKV